MAVDRGLLDRIRTRGEEVLSQVSAELTSNPRFMKAMEGAMRGKERLEEAVGQALKQMNVPTRTDLKRALSRIRPQFYIVFDPLVMAWALLAGLGMASVAALFPARVVAGLEPAEVFRK